MNPYRARVNTRAFLNLPGFHDSAYVVCYVEDTSERQIERPEYGRDDLRHNPDPRIILEIADCDNRICLEFEVTNELRRENSLHKIDTLISALNEFRRGLIEEFPEYDRRQRDLDDYERTRDASGDDAEDGRGEEFAEFAREQA